jgi:anthranilate synthase component I
MSIPALDAGQILPLTRTLTLCPDPIELFQRLAKDSNDTLLLETADTAQNIDSKLGSGVVAGKSILVTKSALHIVCKAEKVILRALSPNGKALLNWVADACDALPCVWVEEKLEIASVAHAGGDEEARLKSAGPLDFLRWLCESLTDTLAEPSTAPFLAGVFAYDLLASFEELPPANSDPLGTSDYEFWLPERCIWIDHNHRRTVLVAYVYGGSHRESSYADALDDIRTMLDAAKESTASIPSTLGQKTYGLNSAPAETDMSDEDYAALVVTLKKHIVEGDVFQIVPSRTFKVPCPDSLAAYRQLRSLNPSPYMFYLQASDFTLFGASPETALKVDGRPSRVTIHPIAGTRPRGRRKDGSVDLDLDNRLEAELRLNEKEVAEHMMLVDLARNDAARVCEPGTRRVDRLLSVERYSHVMHLVSEISGELRHDLDALHAYLATMNMGTLVGAPKVKAAQLLRRYEATRRGPYGGAVGYLSLDGRMDTAIIIRSALVVDGEAYIRAGAGVVYDSDPMAEADETRRKAAAVITAIERAASEAGQ